MRAAFFTASGAAAGHAPDITGEASLLTTSWVQQDGSFRVPANVTQIRIELCSYLNTGWVAFDDVALTGGPTTITKYYTHGGARVVLRQGGTLYYLFSDHFGSTSVSYNTSTGAVSAQRYTPYGAPRGPASTLPTDYQFTGQRSEEATLGALYDYNARFYSPYLNQHTRTTAPAAS